MAERTPVAKSVVFNTAGRYREVQFDITDIADGDTAKVPTLQHVVRASVEFIDSGAVAADSVNVIPDGTDTLTFQAAGTARDCRVVAVGA